MDGDDEESLESVMLAVSAAWATLDWVDVDGVAFDEAIAAADDWVDAEVDITDKSVPFAGLFMTDISYI